MIKQNDYYFDEVNKNELAELPLFAGVEKPPVPKYLDDCTEEKAKVYSELSAEAQREKVFETIKQMKFASDNEVGRALNYTHPSTISARRNELIKEGRVVPVLDPDGNKVKEKDRLTGTKNVIWKVVE